MSKIINELKKIANSKKVKILAQFFKTSKGQYGEGDLFLGITVPELRKIAQKYLDISFFEIEKLLKNKYHEARLVALLILVKKYQNCARQDLAQFSARKVLAERKKVFKFYLKNTKYINNWDLVDLSAGYIVGDYLYSYQRTVLKKASTRTVLFKLAKSKNLWERRIAIISTFAFIYKSESKWTFKIVKMLLKDKHDLIHKACGWMLREVGKRVSEAQLEAFLSIYGSKMPRIMLRYAIERLSEKKRKYYLLSKFYT